MAGHLPAAACEDALVEPGRGIGCLLQMNP
jgi:hypothetical protein